MVDSRYTGAYFPPEYQHIIVKGLGKFGPEIEEIFRAYMPLEETARHASNVKQLIHIIITHKVLGIRFGELHSLLERGRIKILEKHLKDLNIKIMSRVWMIPRSNKLLSMNNDKLDSLIEDFLDFFWVTIGENARDLYKKHLNTSTKRITPGIEVFLGAIPPSQLYPQLSALRRAQMMPYFNAGIYRFINRVSSQKELFAKLREGDVIHGEYRFRTAGLLGFVLGPPNINYLNEDMKHAERLLEQAEMDLTYKLIEKEVMDLSVVSVDGTNIVINRKDKTASNGKGSRGKFFGHKASIAADTYCVPVTSVIDTGSKADISLFPQTIKPFIAIAKKSGKEIMVITADAGYCSSQTSHLVQSYKIIPIIDINFRGSAKLRVLKQTASDLEDLSKKAIKKGLSKSERKQWIDELKPFAGTYKDYEEKARALREKLYIYEIKALRNGLTKRERRKERGLRKKVMEARQDIRFNGSVAEKAIGLGPIPQGTVSWFLIYHIRGQNEGINSIKKKRGNLKGDGQWFSWKIGKKNISSTIKANNFFLKYQMLVYVGVTGQIRHGMRTIYNWKTFFIIWIVI